MNGNPVVPISLANALNASSIINDTTRPVLRAFDLDLNTNIMTLEFVDMELNQYVKHYSLVVVTKTNFHTYKACVIVFLLCANHAGIAYCYNLINS